MCLFLSSLPARSVAPKDVRHRCWLVVLHFKISNHATREEKRATDNHLQPKGEEENPVSVVLQASASEATHDVEENE